MSSAEIYLGSEPVLTLAPCSLWTTGAVFHPKGKALKAKPGEQILSQGQSNSIYDTGIASGEGCFVAVFLICKEYVRHHLFKKARLLCTSYT